jgi:hypothetical protein
VVVRSRRDYFAHADGVSKCHCGDAGCVRWLIDIPLTWAQDGDVLGASTRSKEVAMSNIRLRIKDASPAVAFGAFGVTLFDGAASLGRASEKTPRRAVGLSGDPGNQAIRPMNV